MTEEISRTPNYTMGYSEEFRQLLDRAQRGDARKVPDASPDSRPSRTRLRVRTGHHLSRAGQGCGARRASRNRRGGVAGQSRPSRSRGGRHHNMTFHVGDVTNLPFEDDFFDVAHCHAVLMHVPDTAATLSEVKRVLKPGGKVGARELFVGSSFLEPGGEAVEGAWTAFARLLEANGGHPQMGRELKGAFLDAGFSDLRRAVPSTSSVRPRDSPFSRLQIDEWFYSSEVIEALRNTGWRRVRSSKNGARASTRGRATPARAARSPSERCWPPSRCPDDPPDLMKTRTFQIRFALAL